MMTEYRRLRAFRLMNEIEMELAVASMAIFLLGRSLHADPSLTSILDKKWSRADSVRCRARLGDTYLIRLFAVFEHVIREYWTSGLRRQTAPPVGILIDRVAAKLKIPESLADPVHTIREYRNSLVHEDTVASDRISVPEARADLSRYVTRLPLHWSV
jgi:hypothetical protein